MDGRAGQEGQRKEQRLSTEKISSNYRCAESFKVIEGDDNGSNRADS